MPGGRYPHIIAAVLGRPWMIDTSSLAWAAMMDVLALRAAGETLSEAEIAARLEAAANGPRAGSRRETRIDVIGLYGLISPRMYMVDQMSGGTSAEAFGAAIRASLADPEVDGIVLDIDTPGGNVEGIEEVASLIRDGRGVKPIVAVANHDALSAGYYIAAQASELVVTPSGSVGSIGVKGAHQDMSGAMAQKGIVTTLISAGKYKTEGNAFEPLGDEARAAFQADVDRYYEMFVAAVARGRGVSADAVRSGFGQGRTVMAEPALAAGMVDRIDTLENTIGRLARGEITTGRAQALTTRVVVAEAVGGHELEEPAPPAPEPPEAPAARVIPARRAQLDTRLAAIAGGHSLGS